jgi:hypothetical protein
MKNLILIFLPGKKIRGECNEQENGQQEKNGPRDLPEAGACPFFDLSRFAMVTKIRMCSFQRHLAGRYYNYLLYL